MNDNSERSPNARIGAASTRDAVPFRAGRIQAWFRHSNHEQLNLQLNLRLEERRTEHAGIAHKLHDSGMASTSLEQALSDVGDEFTPSCAGFRILVMGRPKTLKPAIQEQIYLVVREALVNALRHSEATSVEIEIEYQRRQLRVVVRDNGCGIEPQMVRGEGDSHWGLLGMHERARCIGAQLRIWSGRGAGTEVEISVPTDIAADAHGYSLKSPALQKQAVA
jgi:signal transduction histidine kinase